MNRRASSRSASTSGGKVWGRGTLDDKGSLVAILEAVESLLSRGFTPERTVYLAFGHDEEAGTPCGMLGARLIAEHLREKGVHAESILDEGGEVLDENFSFVKRRKLALINVAEKGFVTLKLTASGQSGHAMMPPPEPTIAILANAVRSLEAHQMPYSLDGTVGLTFDSIAPEMPALERYLFANRRLFDPLLKAVLSKNYLIAAMMHTTTAPTVIGGGMKEQSLPATAWVVVNFRILPGETSKDVIGHVKKNVNDPRVAVELYGDVVHEPISFSGFGSAGYETLDRTIREIFPGVIVAPGLMAGRTDSLYYKDVAEDIYRFAPYLYAPGDDKRPHGKDEFITVDGYMNMIRFYARYVENCAGPAEGGSL